MKEKNFDQSGRGFRIIMFFLQANKTRKDIQIMEIFNFVQVGQPSRKNGVFYVEKNIFPEYLFNHFHSKMRQTRK